MATVTAIRKHRKKLDCSQQDFVGQVANDASSMNESMLWMNENWVTEWMNE